MKRIFSQYLAIVLGSFILFGLIAGCNDTAETISVPSETAVVVALQTPLNTESATEGQSFEAITTQPIEIDGKTVAPMGTTVRGYISNLQKPGGNDGARITLDFDEIVTNEGEAHSFNAAPITLVGKSDSDSDVERVAAGTVAGAIIGGIAEGGKGAVVGGLIGAGAGGTWAVVTKGDHIVLNSGQKFRIETTESTELPVMASK